MSDDYIKSINIHIKPDKKLWELNGEVADKVFLDSFF
jgi:hypothetical protein